MEKKLQNILELMLSEGWQNVDLAQNLLHSLVCDEYPSAGNVLEAALNAAKEDKWWKVNKLLEKHKVGQYRSDGPYEVSFMYGCHLQWDRYRDFSGHDKAITYLHDHVVSPSIQDIKELILKFNSDMEKAITNAIDSVSTNNLHEIASFLYLYSNAIDCKVLSIPSCTEVQEVFRKRGSFGECKHKKGDFVEVDDHIYKVVSEPYFARSYNSPHMWWKLGLLSLKRDGSEADKRGHSPYSRYEYDTEYKPTTLDQWEWCKNRRCWVKKD